MWGSVDSVGLLATVFSEYISIEKSLGEPQIEQKNLTVKRTEECQLVISPNSMKSIYSWLGTKINQYETLFGKIATQAEMAKNAKDFGKIQADSTGDSKVGTQYQ